MWNIIDPQPCGIQYKPLSNFQVVRIIEITDIITPLAEYNNDISHKTSFSGNNTEYLAILTLTRFPL